MIFTIVITAIITIIITVILTFEWEIIVTDAYFFQYFQYTLRFSENGNRLVAWMI